MYGTRDAPAVWQKVVKEAMLSLGFVCSSSNPSVFRHERRDILVVTHVDDFLCCAQRDDLDWLWKSWSKRYTLKGKVLGPNNKFREIELLGRRLAWTRSGVTYEADPKHVRHRATNVTSPGVKDERSEEAEVPLAGPGARLYRRTGARLNYLAQDRADLAFATKEVARTMSALHKRRGQIGTHFALRARPSSRGAFFLDDRNCQCSWWLRWTAIGQDAHELGAPLLVAHSALESTAWRTGHELKHPLH